jgi:hypothetical protein
MNRSHGFRRPGSKSPRWLIVAPEKTPDSGTSAVTATWLAAKPRRL